ncbi:bifunctional salicylyl-CoA 5-hydroxylase/oxidoreductase [Gemmatimonas sp.]|uniref:bifunctional salicylyl-CoA 5-hydroxylase/oxidoreductase n=1 Tax=Gemmatimonas sp. TaxID=1962908 RepID=UPI00286BD6DC|nr:bifunctional salicylyl-CoA 5-hydroxylase/oxidoreductase [Gemmatimonas sp.]
MNVVVVGGGPGGLYAALLMKRRDPKAEITVIERNRPDDTFGWGVVLSDQTVANLRAADPESGAAISEALHRWDDIDVRFAGRSMRSGGHGFSGVGRKRLLAILQQRCRDLDVALRFQQELQPDQLEALAAEAKADLVIVSDGIKSRLRERFADGFRPEIDLRRCRYVWLGTPRRFDAFTFAFTETAHGWFQAHAYQFDGEMSTFIVETPHDVWEQAGIADMTDAESIAFCESLFADTLQGAPLVSNAAHLRGSAQWIRFPRVTCGEWVHWLDIPRDDRGDTSTRRIPLVLLGDSAHTAHFSIGSGSKLALEDAIALDTQLAAHPGDIAAALARYQAERSVEVLKLQNAARNSTEWFEHVDRYATLAPEQFAYSLLTRSQRISHENLRVRDAAYVGAFERWFAQQSGLTVAPDATAPPAIFTPFTMRGVTVPNRIVVSPMAQYSATNDGLPTDWHLVHLGARATGGAGLVMTEMTCVAPDARITPVCPGMWNDDQRDIWARIVRFVHEHTPAKIGLQLGHAGAKGATKTMWDGIDQPLEHGAWPLIAASELQYLDGISQTAREMTRDDMRRVTGEFVQAARRGVDAGFDWLELHFAHGYLMSGFLSPLTNRRTDAFGGDLAGRAKFPREVFTAVRAVWPADLPISVRISAHDWATGGNTDDDAVAIATLFRDAGADMIDVSAGQVVKRERPVYGRMWQTPFADRVRQEAGIATIAVGAITDADQANGIIASGRADLVAIGRPHLTNPAWTLMEAAKYGYAGAVWPVQYLAGKSQLDRLIERERAMRAAAEGAPPTGELT